MPKLILCMIILLSTLSVSAQDVLTGFILDESSNKPLAYATIGVKGTPQGTISNEDGAFELSGVVLTDTIKVSYLGYYAAEFVVRDLDKAFEIKLRPKPVQIKTFTVSGDSEFYFDVLVACRKRLLRKSKHLCKAYLELHTDVSDTPGEIIEMYYNADLRNGNMYDLDYKSGRQALAAVDNSFFLSLSTTSIFQQFKLAEGNVDMPDNPLEMNKRKMMKTYQLSLLSADEDDYYHLQFKPKANPGYIFEGEIWIDKETFDPIEVKLNIVDAVVKPFVPIFPNDSLGDVFMQITQRFETFEGDIMPSLLRFEYGFDSYIPFDKRFKVSVKNLGSVKPVRSDGVMYYYDFDQPFFTPVFDYRLELNDYQKILNTPYHAGFWETESVLVLSERMEASLAFFEENGRLTNYLDLPMPAQLKRIGTNLDRLNKTWSDTTRLVYSEYFEGILPKDANDYHQISTIRSKYNIDAKVYLDIVETEDTLIHYSETVFDVYNSFFNLEIDSLSNAFINLYFDITEMARQDFEVAVANETDMTQARMKTIYDSKMVALRRKLEKYLDETGSGKSYDALMRYNDEVNSALGIDNFDLFELYPIDQ